MFSSVAIYSVQCGRRDESHAHNFSKTRSHLKFDSDASWYYRLLMQSEKLFKWRHLECIRNVYFCSYMRFFLQRISLWNVSYSRFSELIICWTLRNAHVSLFIFFYQFQWNAMSFCWHHTLHQWISIGFFVWFYFVEFSPYFSKILHNAACLSFVYHHFIQIINYLNTICLWDEIVLSFCPSSSKCTAWKLNDIMISIDYDLDQCSFRNEHQNKRLIILVLGYSMGYIKLIAFCLKNILSIQANWFNWMWFCQLKIFTYAHAHKIATQYRIAREWEIDIYAAFQWNSIFTIGCNLIRIVAKSFWKKNNTAQ